MVFGIILLERKAGLFFLQSITTMSALLSALFIRVKTVRFMGLSTAGIVAITFLIVMILTPVLLSFSKKKKLSSRHITKGNSRFEVTLFALDQWILKTLLRSLLPT